MTNGSADRTSDTVTAYVVCTTPRSGSGLLCSALWSTGVAGYPDEYLAEKTRRALGAPRRASRKARIRWIRSRGSTPNGVFGMKVHWSHVREARGWLARALRRHIDPDPIQEIVPKAQLVWLRRRDCVRQAVSAYRANQTGTYVQRKGVPAPPATPVPFDFWRLHQWVEEVTNWNAEWLRYFAEVGLEPLELVYEQDLEQNCRPAVRRLLERIGVEIPEGVEIASPFRKQADALSEELVQQYRQEASSRGLPVSPPPAAPPGCGPAPHR